MDNNKVNNNANNNDPFASDSETFTGAGISSDPFADTSDPFASGVTSDPFVGSAPADPFSNGVGDAPVVNDVSTDPFAESVPVKTPQPENTNKQKPKKEKKGSGKKVLIAFLVVLLLVVGGVAASPLLLMKLGDSNIESGNYKTASTMYSVCFNLYGSANRSNAAKSIVEVMNGNTTDGIKHALENGIKVQIAYDLNGGEFINSSRQAEVLFENVNDYSDFYNAMKEHYDFNGWILSKTSYIPDVDDALVEYSLKADFVPHEYTISYTNLYSNEQNNPVKYTIESDTITLDAPERVGYSFINWTGTDISGDTKTVVIPQGSSGNRAYVANWEPNKYNVKFDANWKAEDTYGVPVTYSDVRDAAGVAFPVATGIERIATYNDAGPFPILFRKGYEFKGWSDGKDTYEYEGYKDEGNTRDANAFKGDGIFVETEDTTFTPVFNRIDYKLSYDFAGGSAVTEANYPKKYNVDSDDIAIGSAMRSGYKFLGWLYEGQNVPMANMVIPAHSVGDYAFVAKWQGNPHVVNLNAAGGVVSTTRLNVTYGDPYTIPTPTKLGYEFTGWKEGSKNFTAKGTWNVDKDASLTASWKAIPYTLTFDVKGGSRVNPATQTVSFDRSYSVPSTSRTGYKFMGWFDASGKQYTGGAWNTASNVTVSAKWQAKNYTVSLNNDGGQGASSVTVYYDQSYTIPTPTRIGYKFDGWYSGSTKYSQSGTWTTDGSVSLRAKWTPQSYTLSFDSNVSSKTVTYGSSYTVPSTASKTGYTFEGWYDSDGKRYTGGTWNTPNNVRLTARWSANKYTVYLSPNGGSISDDDVNVTYDAKYDLSEPYKKGYEFLGWYNGSTKVPTTGTWKYDKGMTLTAKWQVAEYTITLKLEEGTISGGKTKYKVTYGSYYSIPNPTREGYIFDGWFKGSKEFSPSGTYDYDDDITLKATWLGKECEVRLDANGGSVSRSYIDTRYGDKYELPDPTRRGHKFKGWYNGSTKISSESTWKYNVESMTLVAEWEVLDITITLDANGGSVSSKTIKIKYGQSFYLPSATKKGYSFSGWSKGSKWYNGDTTVQDDTIDSNITLEAQWTPNKYTIHLDPNGGSVSTSSITVEYGERYKVPDAELEGSRFKGWYLNGKKFDASGTWKREEDIYLVAQWS